MHVWNFGGSSVIHSGISKVWAQSNVWFVCVYVLTTLTCCATACSGILKWISRWFGSEKAHACILGGFRSLKVVPRKVWIQSSSLFVFVYILTRCIWCVPASYSLFRTYKVDSFSWVSLLGSCWRHSSSLYASFWSNQQMNTLVYIIVTVSNLWTLCIEVLACIHDFRSKGDLELQNVHNFDVEKRTYTIEPVVYFTVQ